MIYLFIFVCVCSNTSLPYDKVVVKLSSDIYAINDGSVGDAVVAAAAAMVEWFLHFFRSK